MTDQQNKEDRIRAKRQAYPKFQLKMEEYQLKLNHFANNSNMKEVGKYNVLINKLWSANYKKWYL